MSATKRLKLEADSSEKPTAPVEQEAEIIVDLGNGLLGRLRTHGGEDSTIQEERWQQFKAELYQSEFWQQYKDRLENPDWDQSEEGSKKSYNEVIEREIQRAWDESGKGNKVLHMPQSVRWAEFRNSSSSRGEHPLPDIPLCNQGVKSVESIEGEEREEPQNGRPVVLKETAMSLNVGGRQRYLVTVEYLGSRFLGWQKQKNRPDLRTVQGALEEAFHKFVGQPVVCGGSSRTDTGVHALANVCHVDVERVSKRKPGEVLPPHEPEVVKRAVNHFLQKDGGDVVVVDVTSVPDDFHSRFQARERTYHYRILSGCAHSSIFERDRAWHVPESLNLAAMQEASQLLVGHHDFSSFRAAGCQAKSPLKTLDELHVCAMPAFPCFPSPSERIPYSITQAQQRETPNHCSSKGHDHCSELGTGLSSPPTSKKIETSGNMQKCNDVATMKSPTTPHCFVITARARSFLYHQVRLLVGTLKAVGCGILTADDVRGILEAKSIKSTPAMAPAHGLYLAEVKYNFNEFKTRENMVNEEEGDE
ncbi:unnamed protein product [Calypogeia fissa]